MKKLLLTTMAALTILFAQAQTPCDSITVSGSQYQLTLTSVSTIDYWITTASDGTLLGEDSLWNMHNVYNSNPAGIPYDTIITCLYTMNMTCCVTYVWNGIAWSVQGGAPTPSWDCNTNTLGCFDPGTGLGQYATLASCQSACSVTPSWDCGPFGCYDPGTGLGQYSTLSSCQSVCSTGLGLLCDSIVVSGSQFQLTMQVNNFNSIIDYWITTAPDGTLLGEDSMWNMHNVYNSNPAGIPYDTIITCINYQDFTGMNTCCVEWIWDASSGVWARMSTTTSINQVENYKELIKVVDVLGKESMIDLNKILFFIYSDGTIEKKIYK